ncbi:DUF5961 family protein [Lichenibacterium ramalinae]|uniref:Uncharacterized protein n=1 Tax=Lichenibacterium ramalinae TaxID=2316527 RepID=A0A4Q2R7L2_9HYPH|nr:DUF5961 family protein [Lichenibacterium ramalinae]RYB01941.1 hypothetical protein D3272_23225 [Lichenibacterium ramalinae]
MTEATEQTRRFSVQARHVDAHHARVLEETSFEAAAVAYAEEFGLPFADEHEMSVVVRDLDNGHQHSFRIDLDTGDTTATG